MNRVATLLMRCATSSGGKQSKDLLECASVLERAGVHTLEELAAAATSVGSEPRTRGWACWAIGQLRLRNRVDTLLLALRNDPDTTVVWEAAKALSLMPSRNVGENLKIVLCETLDSERRTATIWSIGASQYRPAIPELSSILTALDEPVSVRAHAAEALGVIGDRRASGALLDVLDDSSPDVRFWATYALGELREQRAVPALKRLACSDNTGPTGWWPVKEEAANALAKIRSERR